MESPEPWERSGSWAFQLALCLLGSLFFVSRAFTIFAPLPCLYLLTGNPNRQHGRFWWLVSFAVGASLSASIYGGAGAIGFGLFVAFPALILGEALLRKTGPERAILAAFLAVSSLALGLVWAEAHHQGLSLGAAIQEHFRQMEVAVQANSQKEEWKALLEPLADNPPKRLREHVPGGLAMMILLICTLPCLAMIRWNPKGFLRRTGIARDFLRKWRSPEWMVWPALACVALLLVNDELSNQIGTNVSKPLLLIYFFQGMSILAYFLDSLRVLGPLRVPVYFVGTIMWPFLASLGFIDLWVNFRSRRRQTEEDKES